MHETRTDSRKYIPAICFGYRDPRCQRTWLFILMATTLILYYGYSDSYFPFTNSNDGSINFKQPLPMVATRQNIEIMDSILKMPDKPSTPKTTTPNPTTPKLTTPSHTTTEPKATLAPVEDSELEKVHHHFLIHTPTCSIPEFDPDHPSIKKFKHPHKKVICGKEKPLTTVSGLTLQLHPENIKDYEKAKGGKDFVCYYQGIQRIQQDPEKFNGNADKKERLLNPVVIISNLTEIKEDGILVTCTVKKSNATNVYNTTIYENVHTFMQPRRAQEKKDKFQESGGWTENPDKLNLVIIGTDATSRLNLLRHIPKTYKYLTEELGALDFRGFNKVGDNTDPNLMAALMGWNQTEFAEQKICHQKGKKKYDDCPLIWKEYSSKGYVTAYAEDAPWMGLFHYNQLGYVKEPTDYYNRPYYRVSEDHISHQGGLGGLNGKICQGSKLGMEVIRDWNLDVLASNKDVPVFSYTWIAALTHDYLTMASLTDEPHLIHLQTLKKEGYLNNSIIVFVSDHGQRWGNIRSTYVGMLEERLPFLFLVFPPWFREKYPLPWSNMVANTRRLTTFFDFHSTLKAIVDQDYTNEYMSDYKMGGGQSLFNKVPLNRTCKSAGIPQHYCACEETEEIDPKNLQAQQAAKFVLKTINNGLQNFPLCAQLILNEVTGARIGKPNNSTTPKTKRDNGIVHRYQITFTTEPGDALFEATVIRDNGEFKISSEASRINKYGDQSHCINDFTYRKYCYCNDLITPIEE